MKQCLIMIGVPGSGKSTICKQQAAELNGDVVIFSLDDQRVDFWMENANISALRMSHAEIYAAAFSYVDAHASLLPNENAAKFSQYLDKAWAEVLTHEIVFVDNTNLTKDRRARWVNEAKLAGFKVTAIDVHAPLETCIARQEGRDKVVPKDIIVKMWNEKQEVTAGPVGEVDHLIHVKNF